MTASADRARRLTGHGAPPCRSRRGAQRWTDARVDAEFAAIVARHGGADVDASTIPPTERCDRPSADSSAQLRERVGRIASALFCASGLDPQVLAFAIGRVAEHCSVDADEVTDRIAAEVVRIAVSVTPDR